MTYIVDQLFPPINTIEESVEFSNFNYWREPVAEMDLIDELDLSLLSIGSTSVAIAGGASHANTPSSHSKQLPTIPENQKV